MHRKHRHAGGASHFWVLPVWSPSAHLPSNNCRQNQVLQSMHVTPSAHTAAVSLKEELYTTNCIGPLDPITNVLCMLDTHFHS